MGLKSMKIFCNSIQKKLLLILVFYVNFNAKVGGQAIISPTHKRTEGRAPVWGSEFTSKRRRTTGGIKQKPL